MKHDWNGAILINTEVFGKNIIQMLNLNIHFKIEIGNVIITELGQFIIKSSITLRNIQIRRSSFQ